MQSMFSYPKAAMERAMKVQEVILRAMAKKITWYQAAKIIGISDRHMRRWRERYEEFGYDGLFDRRRGWPSPKRVPLAQVEQILGPYRDRYPDLNVRHFHEKLREQHHIELSYSWVKQALQGAGLVARGASAECIANGERGGRCRGCCCTSTAAGIAGFRTNAGTT
jgi:transposase